MFLYAFFLAGWKKRGSGRGLFGMQRRIGIHYDKYVVVNIGSEQGLETEVYRRTQVFEPIVTNEAP